MFLFVFSMFLMIRSSVGIISTDYIIARVADNIFLQRRGGLVTFTCRIILEGIKISLLAGHRPTCCFVAA